MRTTPLASVVTSFPAASPTPQEASAIPPRRRRHWVFIACGATVFAAAISVWALRQAGGWLVVQDPLAPAHAIVVLSGGMPYRAREAARVYQENLAVEIWVSQPLSPRAELGKLGIAFVDESFYSEKVLIALGVPADAIHVMHIDAANTEEEISEIARRCRQDNAHRVMIVTSKAHTRRVRFIWHRVVGADPEAVVRYVADDSFDPAHWWRTTGDALEVVREFLGLANAALGFPLRPEPH
jgi:uncharacterized SAM-binding protein YcdF (DUF218 family)